ncbi:MAG: bifunctional diaminohydroxyphosphoribosylaminopyrimidine deaminase/5-amino-6-(5-phosphoribosylamino)uracil reductase RibD [Myxococcales bacterium]
MRVALLEAEKGRGRTHPNPAVGALVVRGGRIVARGHHQKAGGPHAEVVALRKAGARARGADLYVTLEPCNHTGRTPPCTEAILAAGIERVFFGSTDPNPLVDGYGGRKLSRSRVEVHAGIAGDECDASNEPWFKFITSGLPWVVLKAAITLDGKLPGGIVSGEQSRALVHRWRDQLDAILVGAGTVRADDPRLTVRGVPKGRNPIRVVLGTPPKNARLFKEAGETIVAGGPMETVLRDLARRGLTSVLVEGGSNVHGQFLEAGLWDELRLFIAPKIFGEKELSWAGRAGKRTLELRSVARVGEDVLSIYRRRP